MKVAAIFSTVIIMLSATAVKATIINVPADQTTIQAGINASVNYDTVRVAAGTYVENIDFGGKNIVVGSWFLDASDPSYISSTIIDGGASGTVVTFANGETSAAKIIGFTIQNGNGDNAGGIFCSYSSPTISNNTLSGNASNYAGGGISCHSGSPTISYNTISGNTATTGSGGIDCSSSDAVIEHNIISGNTALGADAPGGGISCFWSNPTISYNTISGNTAGYFGGGIFCYEASPSISYNTISGNSANSNFGGGIYCQSNPSPLIDHNTVTQNSAPYGGGIICWDSNPTITSTVFWGDVTNVEIYLYGTSSPVITYSDIQGGWAGDGNIDCDPQFCDAPNGDFSLNSSSCCIGAGEGGSDIGAFGIGCGQPVPTLSEWGMMIMWLLLLALGTGAVVRRRQAAFSGAA